MKLLGSRPDLGGRRGVAILLPIAVASLIGVGWLVLSHSRGEASPVADGRYEPASYYVDPLSDRSNIQPPGIVLGPNGIPLVQYPGIGYHDNPVTAAQYGLWAYGMYLGDHDAAHRGIVLHVADWLVTNQRRGRWFYDFDFYIHDLTLAKPWSSAMAQGQAMSLLSRAYRLTGEQRYRLSALRALPPLSVAVTEGGLRRCFFGDCARPFFEEYPTTPPSYVLNGFMFTLIGLYDLASIAPKSRALSMYAAGRRTLNAALPKYDFGGVATYDLSHKTVPGRKPEPASPDYQAIHVYLLRALDSLGSNSRFRHYADRWEANSPAPAG